MTWLRRTRGVLLRLALARRASIVVGTVLLAPAAAMAFNDYGWESWMTDGLTLVFGATGAALILSGLGGRRGDWVE